MTPSSVRSEVARLNGTLLQEELAISVNGSILKRAGSRVIVTWPSTNGGALSDHVFASIQEYRYLLANREYTALLFDGALIQVSYTFEADEFIGHRLCYYPCPLVLSPDSGIPEFADYFDSQLSSELELQNGLLYATAPIDSALSLRLRGPLRFDYDLRNTAEGHSATHLHIVHEDVRWPIYGPMSIGHFVRLVFRRFYSSLEIESLREWPLQYVRRTVSPDDEAGLFIECRHERA